MSDVKCGAIERHGGERWHCTASYGHRGAHHLVPFASPAPEPRITPAMARRLRAAVMRAVALVGWSTLTDSDAAIKGGIDQWVIRENARKP